MFFYSEWLSSLEESLKSKCYPIFSQVWWMKVIETIHVLHQNMALLTKSLPRTYTYFCARLIKTERRLWTFRFSLIPIDRDEYCQKENNNTNIRISEIICSTFSSWNSDVSQDQEKPSKFVLRLCKLTS